MSEDINAHDSRSTCRTARWCPACTSTKMYRELESTATMLDALADQLDDQTRHDDLEDLPDDMLSAAEGMRVHAAVIRELLAEARGEEVEK